VIAYSLPLGDFELVSESNSLERAQSFEEKMSKTEEQGKVHPPPLDEDGNSIVVEDGSNTETSTAPTMEELMKQLEKLNVEVKKLKAKDKKGKNHSSSSKDDDSSFKEEVSNKGKKERKKCDKSSYNAMPFNYDSIPSSITYTSIPVDKAPYFDGSKYNQWKYCMKNYLYSISPEVWQVVCDGVDLPEEDEQPTSDQL
jgi:hypothetical protein